MAVAVAVAGGWGWGWVMINGRRSFIFLPPRSPLRAAQSSRLKGKQEGQKKEDGTRSGSEERRPGRAGGGPLSVPRKVALPIAAFNNSSRLPSRESRPLAASARLHNERAGWPCLPAVPLTARPASPGSLPAWQLDGWALFCSSAPSLPPPPPWKLPLSEATGPTDDGKLCPCHGSYRAAMLPSCCGDGSSSRSHSSCLPLPGGAALPLTSRLVQEEPEWSRKGAPAPLPNFGKKRISEAPAACEGLLPHPAPPVTPDDLIVLHRALLTDAAAPIYVAIYLSIYL